MTDSPVRSYSVDMERCAPELAEQLRRRQRRSTAVTLVLEAALLAWQFQAAHIRVPIAVGVGAAALALTALWLWANGRRILARELEVMRSYRLELAPGRVRRVLARWPDMELLREEVQRVEWGPQGLYVTGSGGKLIVVPSTLVGYEVVRQELESWAPVEPLDAQRESRRSASLYAWIALGIGSWLAAMWVPDPRIRVVATVLLLAVDVYWLTATWKSPVLPLKNKLLFTGGAFFVALGPVLPLLEHYRGH